MNELLLEWYSYQINQEESQELLDQIGGAIAKSCKALNERGWSGERFTDDFIVYTECVAGDTSSVGLAKCVTHDWLQVKRLEGMLLWA